MRVLVSVDSLNLRDFLFVLLFVCSPFQRPSAARTYLVVRSRIHLAEISDRLVLAMTVVDEIAVFWKRMFGTDVP